MRSTGIVVCILAMLVASAPCRAQDAKPAGALAPKKTGTPSKAKSAKKAAEPVQQAFIAFYWPKESDWVPFPSLEERLSISVDGQPAGKVTQGEFISVPVQPGPHTYGYTRSTQTSEGERKGSVEVPQGQTVYLETVKTDHGIVTVVSMQQVTAEHATQALPGLKSPLQLAPKEAVIAPKEAVTETLAPNPKPANKPAKKSGEPPMVPPSYITFYWPKSTDGFVAFESLKEHYSIFIDGQLAGRFSEGEFISVEVQPGPHTYGYVRSSQFSIGDKGHSVDISPGQSVYFEIVRTEYGMVTLTAPQPASAEQAQQALPKLKAPEKDE